MNGTALDELLATPEKCPPGVRFALYYAPPRDSAWWTIGCDWLAREPQTGEPRIQPDLSGLADGTTGTTLADLTAAPRAYGWHATLCAPFVCAPGIGAADVLALASQWAARQIPFTLPVAVATIGRFVAIRPEDAHAAAAIGALAADAVRTLHALRATPGRAELEKRRARSLTPSQEALLVQWGYPYVFDEFRFHMTLSDNVSAAHARVLIEWWQPRLPALGPLPIDGVALFVQPGPGEPFVLWRRLPFAAAGATGAVIGAVNRNNEQPGERPSEQSRKQAGEQPEKPREEPQGTSGAAT